MVLVQSLPLEGGGPRVVVSTAAFHARVRGSVPGLGGLKETKMFLPHPRVKLSIVGSLRDREVACSASDRQGSDFESCVWRTVSSHSSQRWPKARFISFHLPLDVVATPCTFLPRKRRHGHPRAQTLFFMFSSANGLMVVSIVEQEFTKPSLTKNTSVRFLRIQL